MKVCAIFVLLSLASLLYAQDAINTGQGLSCLYFPGNGGVELKNCQNCSSLSTSLPLSFSFEAWIMLPNPPADGVYKSLTARWDIGPDRTFDNRWADFDFQVQASGTLNFFMGNGLPSSYGVLIPTTNLAQGVWVQVAFTVSTPRGALNPDVVNVYADLAQWNKTWLSGNRQLPTRERSIFLGDYFNQDGDHKWWIGYLDEVRFWSGVRSLGQIGQYRQRVVPVDATGLLAYYRFNDAAGSVLQDATNNRFDGSLYKVTTTTTSPLWKVSGAKINVDVQVTPAAITTIYLPGASPSGALGFTYTIESLPATFTSAVPVGVGRLLADGQFVTTTPFPLVSNQVAFEAPNITGTQVSFSYYGTSNILNPNAREAASTTVYVQIGNQPCIADICGKCNGDNSTCSCLPLPYNGYSLGDVQRILLLYEIQQTVSLLDLLESKLLVASKSLASHQVTDLQVVISEVQQFNQNCLLNFCTQVNPFLDSLAAIAPQ
jgi:hypothetical protein